ncbi:hypothetical protein C482_07416 [Natrialba chahannaoensis JCM 10990]|uniref:DUF7344 domain-containing protein n=1 Tax=Natrialba chahannaoensis JCM 10990 TaxID=1227492 RepID=M0AV90_9EURY|nr:hypothetical protein [Natrialba chahannaoensis]ELZ01304.1 hypothetical protein C482_07416 [Natrialba chahannaoensis JCM 10990]
MSSHTAPVDVERFVRLTDVSLDDAYALLANGRLRVTLHALSACEGPVSVDWLTEITSQWDDDPRETVKTELIHNVLPKLDDHRILEYDVRSGIVRMDDPVVAFEHPQTESLLVSVTDGSESTA